MTLLPKGCRAVVEKKMVEVKKKRRKYVKAKILLVKGKIVKETSLIRVGRSWECGGLTAYTQCRYERSGSRLASQRKCSLASSKTGDMVLWRKVGHLGVSVSGVGGAWCGGRWAAASRFGVASPCRGTARPRGSPRRTRCRR